MHLPDSMITTAICPVTLAAGIGTIAYAVRKSSKNKEQIKKADFASVTALIFALQMLNYPIGSGVSGHFVGAFLAVGALGLNFGLLSMAAVLAVQAIIFGDGGILAFGANFICMGIVPGLIARFSINYIKNLSLKEIRFPLFGLGAYVSVVAASFVCGLIISPFADSAVLTSKTMILVHSKIAVGEAILTAFLLWRILEGKNRIKEAAIYTILAAFISPFASSFPDGLEYSVEHILKIKTGFESIISGIIPDYSFPFLNSPYFSTLAAALAGIIAITALSMFFSGKKI